MLTFTQRDFDVLFHIINNLSSESFDRAVLAAWENDGITKDEFLQTYRGLFPRLHDVTMITVGNEGN